MDEITNVEESLFDEVEEVDEESLFDDEEDETVEEAKETDETPTEESEEETIEEEPFMTVRFNKEDKKLSREEATTWAQKGMNYDHLNGKYESLNSSLKQLAQMNGMDVEQYLESLNKMQVNYAIAQEVKALQEKYPNSDENLLKEIAQTRVNERFEQTKTQNAQTKNNEAEMQRNEIKRQIEVFEKRYPNVAPDKLAPEVYELMDENGFTLLEAYQTFLEHQRSVREHENQKKNEIDRINMKNKKKSLGNIGVSENTSVDDFMKGFMG